MPKVFNRHKHGIPDHAIYVGRSTKWGNPFVPGTHGSRLECIEMYENWIKRNRMKDIEELRGKDLVCSCAPLPCHADVLVRLANE